MTQIQMVYDKVSPMIPITTQNPKINGFVVKIPQNLINYYLFLIKSYNKLQKKNCKNSKTARCLH